MSETKTKTNFYLLYPEENKAYQNQLNVIYQTKYYNNNKDKVLEYKKNYYQFQKQSKIFRNILLD
jgi:hypothetical protein